MKTSLLIRLLFALIFIISCKSNHQTSKDSGLNERNHDSTNKDYLSLGFELMQNEKFNNIRLGLKPDSLRILLGEPDKITTPEEWAAFGSDFKSYIYDSLGLKLDLILSPDSIFSVKTITIFEPCKFKSTKGIGINCKYEDVLKSYHRYIDPKISDSNNIVAGSVNGGILFKLQNNKVKTIFLGAAAD
jgi:hypothetical protein